MLNKLILPTDNLYYASTLGRTCGHQFGVRAERWGFGVWGCNGEDIIVPWETLYLDGKRDIELSCPNLYLVEALQPYL
jgi:hypothetical protein